jgi:soluble lytic murein transglycosylase-like protein
MIGKIDPQNLIGLKPIPSAISSPTGESFDFRSILKEKLEGSNSLESMFLEYLKRAVELVLSESTPEGDLFLSSPLFLKSLIHPLPLNPQPVSQVSNNLHGNQDFDRIVQAAAQYYGMEPSLVKAVIQAESSGNPLAVSPAGAQGLMQLMPETAAELGVRDSFDPAQNIMAGTRYLRRLLDRYRGDVKLALAAYNWGMGNLENQPETLPRETKDFIARVENYYRSYMKS